MQPLALQAGTWADWANAAATTLAFTVALVLFVIGLKDRRRANEDRRQADEDHLRDQARRIWIRADRRYRDWDEDESKFVAHLEWVMHNTSDEPVSNCRVGFPWSHPETIADSKPDIPFLLPNQKLGGRKFGVDQTQHDLIMAGDHPPPVQLIFTDAAGVQWRRFSTGDLDLWKRPRR